MVNLNTINEAKHYTDLFAETLDEKAAEKRYLRLQRIAHPDVNLDEPKKAEEAFINLARIWETRPFNKTQTTATAKNVIKTRKHSYLFTDKLYTTPDTTYYKAEYDAGHKEGFIAISKTPTKNSDFTAGIRAVTKIRKNTPVDYIGYFPTPTDVFTFANRGEQLSAAMLEFLEPLNTFYTLKEILNHYPNKVNAKDVTWMYKRMLIALNETHNAGYVHGNISLNSFLIHPQRHGLVLTEWNNVKEIGQQLKEIPSPLPQFLKNSIATPQVDISAAALVAANLCNVKTTPPRFINALKGAAQYPPANAVEALEELADLNQSLWGEPVWHDFKMPLKK